MIFQERITSRGSCEVGSCNLKCIRVNNPTAIHLTTYSDSWGKQNHNITLVSLWLHIVSNDNYYLNAIDQIAYCGWTFIPIQ